MKKAMQTFDRYLDSGNIDFCFIHDDIHFDNIFYKDGKLKIIDFESSRFNPICKELEIIYHMAEMPWKYASEESERFVRAQDYKTLIPHFKKHYPDMFKVPHLEKRIAIYRLRDVLEQYGTFTADKELRERIIALAKVIVGKPRALT